MDQIDYVDGDNDSDDNDYLSMIGVFLMSTE